jgi:stage V sporulation protein R
MVIAHVIGHVHFFKNNYLFKETDRKMIYQAASRAQRIDEYIEKYGLEKVERIMDMGFAFDKHIDWDKGVQRAPYPKKSTIYKKRRRAEFEDLSSKKEPSVSEVTVNKSFPPHSEFDILWFVINYAPLKDWEKDILEIIRKESFYFYPQYYTKIMNEGFASYMHAELMHLFDDISHSDHLNFCKIHEKVVQPGGNKLNINPYFLGFSILNDIKSKWDELHKNGESQIDGFSKILQVIKTEDDISFLKNYLSQELIDDLGMFTYVKQYNKTTGEYIEVESKSVDDVAEGIAKTIYNYRVPLISIEEAHDDGLCLKHHGTEIGTLDQVHLEKIMEYLRDLWGGGLVDFETVDDNGEAIHYTYDELGFSHDAGFKLPDAIFKVDI